MRVRSDAAGIEPVKNDEAVAPFAGDTSLMMSTLRRRIEDDADRSNPNVTKVGVDRDDYALYFSRAPVPFTRHGCQPAAAWRHVGLYVYRRECLLRLSTLPPTDMERAEALEQLRALEYGIRIKAVETRFDSVGVDTPEDLERRRATVAARGARLAHGEPARAGGAGGGEPRWPSPERRG